MVCSLAGPGLGRCERAPRLAEPLMAHRRLCARHARRTQIYIARRNVLLAVSAHRRVSLSYSAAQCCVAEYNAVPYYSHDAIMMRNDSNNSHAVLYNSHVSTSRGVTVRLCSIAGLGLCRCERDRPRWTTH